MPAPPEKHRGTLAYMAPEQTGRMNRSVDSRSDLYALGVIFYEMLTARCPSPRRIQWNGCTATSPGNRNLPMRAIASIPRPALGARDETAHQNRGERYQTAAGSRSICGRV